VQNNQALQNVNSRALSPPLIASSIAMTQKPTKTFHFHPATLTMPHFITSTDLFLAFSFGFAGVLGVVCSFYGQFDLLKKGFCNNCQDGIYSFRRIFLFPP
jgi:hypothetical protein